MNDWIDTLQAQMNKGETCVLLTVCGVRGSAPREVGARMIVTSNETVGTIGGGQLEYLCVRLACEQLRGQSEREASFVRRFPLGSNCGQCCGGVVDVMFETLAVESGNWLRVLQEAHGERRPCVVASALHDGRTCAILSEEGCLWSRDHEIAQDLQDVAGEVLANDTDAIQRGGYLLQSVRQSGLHIAVFGAGHVGTAIVDALARLDADIRWVDSRRKYLPDRLPGSVTALESAAPAREVAAMPPGSYYLVMTHSHPLDLEICSRILRRKDAAYCGLIGSVSKRRRFERLMRKQGLDETALQQLTCPIGIDGIDGKKPVEIALAVAAEVLQVRDAMLRTQANDVDNVACAPNVHII